MNRHVARARLTELIYTRLVILELFCQVGQELSQGPLPDEYKKYWLLLQLKPGRLAGDSLDIFAELSRRIRGSAEDDTIDDLLEPMMKRIRGIVASHRSSGTSFPLYCVVDEAQSAAGRCTGAFRSAAMPDLIRPILREIVAAWIQIIGLWLILAGTGMSKEVVMETMASAVVKNDDYTMHYDIGGFDDDTAQFDYMTGLMPEEFKNTSEAEKIFELAHYWLRGRFRFTAALMRELLLSGFTDCEAVFQQYINASTAPRDARARPIASPLKGFRPTGGKLDRWLAKLPPRTVRGLQAFKFDRLKEHPKLFERVKMIISTFYLRNNIKVPLTDAEFEAVEYGFARFAAVDGAATVAPVPPHQKPIRIVLDEPLVVLALQQWLGENDISVHDGLSLRARLGVQEAGSKSNGLEEYFAFYLSTVFDNETPLTSIFRFHPKRVPVWANEPAKLISLYRRDAPWKDGDTRRLQSGRVLEAARPSVSLGMGATSKYVRIWMRHGIKTPFIFPDTGMGPDILFILELGDELRSRIWVAVQSKYSAASLLRREELEKALRSVTPSRFYLGQPKEAPETPEEIAERAKGQALHAGILPLLEALPGRLKYFPRQPKQSAGKYSLLRVVAGWKSRIELHERGDPSTKKKEPPKRTGQKREREPVAAEVRSSSRIAAVKAKEALEAERRPSADSKLKFYDDADKHPVAELNIEYMAQKVQLLHPQESLDRIDLGNFVDAKDGKQPMAWRRDYEDVMAEPPTKKMRLDSPWTDESPLTPLDDGSGSEDAESGMPPPSTRFGGGETEDGEGDGGPADSKLPRKRKRPADDELGNEEVEVVNTVASEEDDMSDLEIGGAEEEEEVSDGEGNWSEGETRSTEDEEMPDAT